MAGGMDSCMHSRNAATVLCSYHIHMSDFRHAWVLRRLNTIYVRWHPLAAEFKSRLVTPWNKVCFRQSKRNFCLFPLIRFDVKRNMLDTQTKKFEKTEYIQIMYTHWSGVTSHKKQTKNQSSHRAARPSYLTAGVHHWLLHDFFSCWLTLTINLGSGRTPEAKPATQDTCTYTRTHAHTHTHTHTHSAPWQHLTIRHHLTLTLSWQVMDVRRNFAGAARRDGWVCADVFASITVNVNEISSQCVCLCAVGCPWKRMQSGCLVYPIKALTQLFFFVLQGLNHRPAPALKRQPPHINKQLHPSQGYISAVITTATRSPKSTTSLWKGLAKQSPVISFITASDLHPDKSNIADRPLLSPPLCFSSNGWDN